MVSIYLELLSVFAIVVILFRVTNAQGFLPGTKHHRHAWANSAFCDDRCVIFQSVGDKSVLFFTLFDTGRGSSAKS